MLDRAYSLITYICAYFKANYPEEFFCALMTVRSNMQPKLWALKAPEYVHDAKQLGVDIVPPTINQSIVGFSIKDGHVFFGLNAIKSVGKGATRVIVNARASTPFKDIQDFFERVNRTKINTKVFESLVRAGAFDRMGYQRQDLLDNMNTMYEYFKLREAAEERRLEKQKRLIEDASNTKLIEERDSLRILLKDSQKKRSPGPELLPYQLERLEELENLKLKKRSELQDIETIEFPVIEKHTKVRLSIDEIIQQGTYIGCFLNKHPASVIYSDAHILTECEEGDYIRIGGIITSIKEILTKKGDKMAFMQLSTPTENCELVVFASTLTSLKLQNQMPQIGTICAVTGKLTEIEPLYKMRLAKVEIYRS